MSYPDSVSSIIEQIRTDRYLQLLTALILVWGVFDTASTYIAAASYGTFEYELNPLMREALKTHPLLLTVSKTVGMLAIGYIGVKGRPYITDVKGWDYYFYALILTGVIVTGLNMYAATTNW